MYESLQFLCNTSGKQESEGGGGVGVGGEIF